MYWKTSEFFGLTYSQKENLQVNPRIIQHRHKLPNIQQKEIQALLPALISLENPESTKPKVSFYEGEKGLRQAYEDTLTSSETILAYANVEDMHRGLPNFFPDYYQRRGKEKKIHIKAIFPDNKISLERHKKDKAENRESLIIPSKNYDFSPEVNVYDDKVLYASWREKMAIIIKSKEIADFHKKMYKLCWAQAKLEHKKLKIK